MLLDTSAWIEFFQGTGKGKKVAESLRKEEAFTSIVSFAEITNWCLKNGLENLAVEYIGGIKKASTVLDLDETISVLAGKINRQRKQIAKNWGMLDSFIAATAAVYGLSILTKDSHFADLPNVEML